MKRAVILIIQIVWEITKAIYGYIMPKPKKSVKNEVVLLTGAGGGIGREIALIYASEGATVVCVDVNEETNQETVKAIANLGYTKAYAYTCDVSNWSKVVQLTAQVEKEVGNVTILVNNAGIVFVNDICKISTTEIEKMVNVNLMAQFWMVKAILPSMLRNNYGHIVAVASVTSFLSIGYLLPYSASKYAVQGFMKGLQNELTLNRKCKIKTTIVHPCLIDTPLSRNANVKHSSLFPIFKADYTAQVIVDCQRRDVMESVVPHQFYLTLSPFVRILPSQVVRLLCEYFEFKLRTD